MEADGSPARLLGDGLARRDANLVGRPIGVIKAPLLAGDARG
jgi:hypothetical protein